MHLEHPKACLFPSLVNHRRVEKSDPSALLAPRFKTGDTRESAADSTAHPGGWTAGRSRPMFDPRHSGVPNQTSLSVRMYSFRTLLRWLEGPGRLPIHMVLIMATSRWVAHLTSVQMKEDGKARVSPVLYAYVG